MRRVLHVLLAAAVSLIFAQGTRKFVQNRSELPCVHDPPVEIWSDLIYLQLQPSAVARTYRRIDSPDGGVLHVSGRECHVPPGDLAVDTCAQLLAELSNRGVTLYMLDSGEIGPFDVRYNIRGLTLITSDFFFPPTPRN